jgi:hypothetical protein
VGGQSAANVAATVMSVAAATGAATANTIVRRDANASFSAGNITATDILTFASVHTLRAQHALHMFIGNGAGNATSIATGNIGVGPGVLASISTGANNTALGRNALNTAETAANNTALGFSALQDATAGGNTAVGSNAAKDLTTGTLQTVVGAHAFDVFLTGTLNTVVGANAGGALTSGNHETLIGANAGLSLSSGDQNTLIGSGAGSFLQDGERNVIIGAVAASLLTEGSDNIYIATPGGAAIESNTIRIGQNQNAAYIRGIFGQTAPAGIAVYVDNTGKLGTATSSRRFKQDIQPLSDATSTVLQLRPVTFRYLPQYGGGETLQYGLIAEEVAQVEPSLVVYDADGQPLTVRYHFLVPLLLSEVQSQRVVIDEQRALLAAQAAAMEALVKRVEALEQRPLHVNRR